MEMASILKKAGLSLLVAGVTIVAGEMAASRHLLGEGRAASRSELVSVRREHRPADDVTRVKFALHPLFGYVYRTGGRMKGINNHGFQCPLDFEASAEGLRLKGVSANRYDLVVGVLGASVARMVGMESRYFEEGLRRQGKAQRPLVLSLAVGGHALPQSFNILTYYLPLCDYVVFIDGFNEIVNGVVNNRQGLPPDSAHGGIWKTGLSRRELKESQVAVLSELVRRRTVEDRFTNWSLAWPWRRSALVHLAWARYLRRSGAVVAALNARLYEDYTGGIAPFYPLGDEEVVDYMARRWRDYHAMIHALCCHGRRRDLHVLQPTLAFEGSKPLSVEEQVLLERESDAGRHRLNRGYRLLREHAQALSAEGVPVLDLTMVFSATSNRVYRDLCHPDRPGTLWLIDRLIEKM